MAGGVTFGGFSPNLEAPIAMDCVRWDLTAPGTPSHPMIRGAAQPAVTASMPFVPNRILKS